MPSDCDAEEQHNCVAVQGNAEGRQVGWAPAEDFGRLSKSQKMKN